MSDSLEFNHYPIPVADLPDGWTVAVLRDVLSDVQPGFASGKHNSEGDGIPHLRPMNVSPRGTIDLSDVRFVDGDNPRRLKKGDILFNNTNSPAWVGKTALVDADQELAFSNHMTRLRAADDVDPAFLAKQLHFLCASGYFQHQCKKHVNQASISTSFLTESVPVVLPPVEQQRRIAEKIDELQARSRTAREALEAIPPLLEKFRESVLAAAFRGDLTAEWRVHNPDVEPAVVLLERMHPAGRRATRRGVPEEVEVPETLSTRELPRTWAMVSIAELLRSGALIDLKDGNHGANHPKRSEFSSSGLPFITAAQVGDSHAVDYDGAPKVGGNVLDRLRVGFSEPGDVILTHKGTVGRTAINERSCVLSPQTTFYRCNEAAILPGYLMHLLASPFFYDQLSAAMSQTTRDFVPISAQYQLFAILPPLREQYVILQQIEGQMHRTTSVAAASSLALRSANTLESAILAKAFRGELVPQDPNDEPASVLLERIRGERGRPRAKQGRRART